MTIPRRHPRMYQSTHCSLCLILRSVVVSRRHQLVHIVRGIDIRQASQMFKKVNVWWTEAKGGQEIGSKGQRGRLLLDQEPTYWRLIRCCSLALRLPSLRPPWSHLANPKARKLSRHQHTRNLEYDYTLLDTIVAHHIPPPWCLKGAFDSKASIVATTCTIYFCTDKLLIYIK